MCTLVRGLEVRAQGSMASAALERGQRRLGDIRETVATLCLLAGSISQSSLRQGRGFRDVRGGMGRRGVKLGSRMFPNIFYRRNNKTKG